MRNYQQTSPCPLALPSSTNAQYGDDGNNIAEAIHLAQEPEHGANI